MRVNRTIRLRASAAISAGLMLLVTAEPATATRPTVDASDFPGVSQIASILPAYDGGTRTIESDHPIWVLRANCLSYENGPSGVVRKFAYYGAPESDQPSYPNLFVQEFPNVAGAERAIRTIRRNIEGCYGTIREPWHDGVFIKRPADVPQLGDGRPVAWKMNDHWTQGRDGLKRIYYSRRIWMREGDTVIGVDLWGEVAQSRADAIALAELALETVD